MSSSWSNLPRTQDTSPGLPQGSHVPAPNELAPSAGLDGVDGPQLLGELLAMMLERKASDLHCSASAPPCARIDGKLVPLPFAALTGAHTERLAEAILSPAQRQHLAEQGEVDLAFNFADAARFRANVYTQRGELSLALRQIPVNVLSFERLGLPRILADVARRPRGLVLVTGPVGSGKSTTLAALLDLINREKQGHIITIEDPIEFLHENKTCVIEQREVGSDTGSFSTALKYVLRQDPDVVFIGEMRDLETIEAALTISETGRLAMATLHTNSTAQTINRIIDVFQADRQAQVRNQLSLTLQAIVCQSLLPRIGGGRAMAMEILVPNVATRSLIREHKVHQIYSQLQAGRGKTGNQSLNQSLADLVLQKTVTLDDALSASSDPDELVSLIPGAAAGTGQGARP